MKLYQLKMNEAGQKVGLNEMTAVGFNKERQLQNIIEANLALTMDIDFIASEFTVGKYRMDTIGYDRDMRAFVIIEYKRTQRYSVIDQGTAYLNTLINHKADFVLAYNEKFNERRRTNDFDWTQTRVAFIAQKFDEYQRDAASNPDLPIELYTADCFANGVVSLNKLEKTNNVPRNANNVGNDNMELSKNDAVKVKDIKELTPIKESDLVGKGSDSVQELYEKIKETLLDWDANFEIKATKVYIGFRLNRHNVVDLLPQKRKLKIWINLDKGELDDPEGLFRDVSDTGHWGNGAYELSIVNDERLEYIMSLIKQSWRKRK
ncbi:DUF5655 domain-containing protein [Levilactobacillus spicheri]|uniref:DUF5655 domain-containing protein n=3 Tax=Levilactobacillus spicheri TaxID=216463 RepID=A0ABQ0WS83_9LACO|nr:DUF5655 domain-containing protein [Levilactobacillus spicheri]KRL48602.1 hypothetical protein FD37_GL001062 [Levilactobacillus spicheri DSM 15429]GEO66954.1 hypothetical protein LSP04_13730 [Levilactobacillus spicheri]